jgi:hypothetical protein
LAAGSEVNRDDRESRCNSTSRSEYGKEDQSAEQQAYDSGCPPYIRRGAVEQYFSNCCIQKADDAANGHDIGEGQLTEVAPDRKREYRFTESPIIGIHHGKWRERNPYDPSAQQKCKG